MTKKNRHILDERDRYLKHPAVKLTEWESEPEIRNLKGDLEAARPFNLAHREKVQKWNDLKNVKRIKETNFNKNKSRIAPKLIKKQLNWKYPAYSEPFLNTPQLFKVTPRGPEDALAAKQNETILNWQFDTVINKVHFIGDYVRSAIDDGVAIVKLGWKRETEKAVKEFPVFEATEVEDVDQAVSLEESLQGLIEMKQKNAVEFLKQSEEIQETVRLYAEEGIVYNVVVVEREEREYDKILYNHPTVETINPFNFYIDPTCEGNYTEARYIINSYETTRSDLMKDKRYSNLDSVNWNNVTDAGTDENHVRSERDLDYTVGGDTNNKSKSKVVVYEYWGFHDKDGDGILRPIVASWIGDIMIRLEDNPYADKGFPFVLANYQPTKRELFGEADAELIEENQIAYGGLFRSVIDLNAKSAVGQTGVARNLLDAEQKKKYDRGEDYLFNATAAPSGNQIIEHTHPPIQQSTIHMMDRLEKDSEALGGTTTFSDGVTGNAFGDVAAGVNATLSSTAKRENASLRYLSKGVQDIGTKVANMNQMFLSEEEVVRVTNGGFISIKRDELQGNFDIIVEISIAEVDEKKALDLERMYQTIGPGMQANLGREMLATIADLKKLPVFADKLRNYEPTELDKKLSEIEVKKAELELSKLESEIQANIAKGKKSTADAEKTTSETMRDNTGVTHAENMEHIGEQSRGNILVSIIDEIMKPLKEGEKRDDSQLAIALGLSDLNEERKKAPLAQKRQEVSEYLYGLIQEKAKQLVEQDKQGQLPLEEQE